MLEALSPPHVVRGIPTVAAPIKPAPGTWLLGLVALGMLALAIMMVCAGLIIDPSAADTFPYYVVAAVAVGIRYAMRAPRSRGQRIARDVAEYFGLFTLIALMGTVASYPISSFTRGFADPALQSIDDALGFDWLAWYNLVAAHRTLQILGTIAYQSIYFTPALLLGYWATVDRRRDAYAFLGTFWVAGVLSLATFSVMPAVGPFASLWHGPIAYMPDSALWQPQLIPELRAHLMHRVDLGDLKGLVSAPSFHTVSAVLYVAFAWPIRRLRWPVLALNVAMLLATPVEGTHYLADMLCGALVAAVALVVSQQVRARRAH